MNFCIVIKLAMNRQKFSTRTHSKVSQVKLATFEANQDCVISF